MTFYFFMVSLCSCENQQEIEVPEVWLSESKDRNLTMLNQKIEIDQILISANDLEFLVKHNLVIHGDSLSNLDTNLYSGWVRELNGYLPAGFLQGEKSGRRNLYANTKLSYYKNGIRDGPFLEFSPEGKVVLSALFRDGELFGNYSFYPTEKKKSEFTSRFEYTISNNSSKVLYQK